MRPRGERETENEPRGKEAPVKGNGEVGGAPEASGRQRTDGADEKDQLRPRILFADVIEDMTDAHAIIVNRNRSGSMIIPGDTLGVSEVTPALFAAVAANEAERAAPGVTLVDVSMIGAAGRIDLSGPPADVRRAQCEITEVLSAVAGRDHLAVPHHPAGPHHLVGREP